MINIRFVLSLSLHSLALSLSLRGKHMKVNRKMIKDMVVSVQAELRNLQDADRAASMQRYLKTEMPMYGLHKAARLEVEKVMHQHVVVDTIEMYQATIKSLWQLPHREEKYLAIDLALKHKQFIGLEALDLFESMLREDYMWWDLSDPISVNLIGRVAMRHDIESKLSQWIDDDNLWLRRTAILAQLKHKTTVNADLLFGFCRERMHEREFFVRKAIGWALREYSKTNPEAVIAFLNKEKTNLSGLSYREGAKLLVRQGKI
jgi:3-methyladenine DNA glycosylase AlkD